MSLNCINHQWRYYSDFDTTLFFLNCGEKRNRREWWMQRMHKHVKHFSDSIAAAFGWFNSNRLCTELKQQRAHSCVLYRSMLLKALFNKDGINILAGDDSLLLIEPREILWSPPSVWPFLVFYKGMEGWSNTVDLGLPSITSICSRPKARPLQAVGHFAFEWFRWESRDGQELH